MRITCPFCGVREHSEFVCLGAAAPERPDPDAPDAARLFHDAVYLRDNPAGPLKEHWYHAAACRRWLVVERDTRDHDILSVAMADPAR